MSKLLLLVAVFAAVWWLAKGFRRQHPQRRRSEPAVERMVRCAHCGIYLPQGEAVSDGDKHYCSTEHRRLAG